MPQTPRAKKVIEYAIEEARNLKQNYVGTEHLLLGLMREQEGVAGAVLMFTGLRLEDVRKEAMNVLGISTSDRDEAIRQADLSRTQKPTPAVEWLAHFPVEAKQALAAIDTRIVKLVQQKEDAVAEQEFERAAYLNDLADNLRRKVLQAIKKLRDLVGESEDDAK